MRMWWEPEGPEGGPSDKQKAFLRERGWILLSDGENAQAVWSMNGDERPWREALEREEARA